MRSLPKCVFAIACATLCATVGAQRVEHAEVTALRRLVLRAQVDGTVADVSTTVGAAVAEGATLLQLHAPGLDGAVEAAAAQVQAADVALRAARIAKSIAEKRLGILRRDLEIRSEQLGSSGQRLEAAKTNLQSQQSHFEAGRLPPSAVRQARLEQQEAEERWHTLGEQVKADQERIAIGELERARTELDIEAAEAELQRRRAELAAARERAALTRVQAPFAGIVRSIDVCRGATVGRLAATPLLELVDASQVVAVLRVGVATARTLAPGTTVRVVDPAEARSAEVTSVDPCIDPATATRTVRIVLDNAEGRLLPGSRVGVELPTR